MLGWRLVEERIVSARSAVKSGPLLVLYHYAPGLAEHKVLQRVHKNSKNENIMSFDVSRVC